MTAEATSPSREIDALLTEASLDAERLLSVLRMVVATGLGFFFVVAVSPAGIPEDQVLLRQWIYATATILAYFMLGFAAWRLSARNLFRPWMVWPVALADILFVLSGIWLGLLNTGLSGDALFVLPSIWLLPVVLAFGVVRGDPAVMAFKVAVFWVALVALILAPGEVPANASPVGLFLSAPPNFMRVAMVVLTGLVLVISTHRFRMLLRKSMRDAYYRANLTRFLPSQLADELGATGLSALQQGRRENVGVLFIDICGFTGLSQSMTPREVSDFVSEFRRRVTGAARDTRGIVDKFMGDAAMIVFEGPEAAARCLACGEALRTEMHTWSSLRIGSGQSPVRAGIGAHWGEVFSGVVGDHDRLEYSVFGDTVNIAARLESLTRELGMDFIVSDSVIRAAGVQAAEVGMIRLEPVEMRGRDGYLNLFGRPAKTARVRS